jgi:hypothetical protein
MGTRTLEAKSRRAYVYPWLSPGHAPLASRGSADGVQATHRTALAGVRAWSCTPSLFNPTGTTPFETRRAVRHMHACERALRRHQGIIEVDSDRLHSAICPHGIVRVPLFAVEASSRSGDWDKSLYCPPGSGLMLPGGFSRVGQGGWRCGITGGSEEMVLAVGSPEVAPSDLGTPDPLYSSKTRTSSRPTRRGGFLKNTGMRCHGALVPQAHDHGGVRSLPPGSVTSSAMPTWW